MCKILVKMSKSETSKCSNITGLPLDVLEHIFSYLKYIELAKLKAVCECFRTICNSIIRTGTLKILKDLSLKIASVNDHLYLIKLAKDKRKKLNETYTTLEMLKSKMFAAYILNRHYTNYGSLCFPMEKFLDEISQQLRKLYNNNILIWHQSNETIKNIIANFNSIIPTYEKQNSNFPLGVHIMDILDVLIGVNYDITCVYYTHENICYINAMYYTDNIKFLLYLPDFAFLRDCQDRQLNASEEKRILKYLMLLANLHNSMFSKNEEYSRSVDLKNYKRKSMIKKNSLYRKQSTRKVFDFGKIIETYHKNVNVSKKKALLNCEICLKCYLHEAPFQIMHSYEQLLEEAIVNESMKLNKCDSKKIYGAKLQLKLAIQQKLTETFEICITDGNELKEDEFCSKDEEKENTII